MRLIILCLLIFVCVTVASAQQAESESQSPVEFTPQQQGARQAILTSERWQAARAKFSQWLLVQQSYDVDEVVELEKNLKERIARMSSDELAAFLVQMDAKLDILLSPEVSAARDTLNEYFTDTAKEQLAKKYGIENPMEMSPRQIQQALERYQRDLDSQVESRAAFDQMRQSEAAALRSYRATQQQQLQSARKQAARFGQQSSRPTSAYAPRQRPQVQTYRSPYPKANYTIGPWGGVWIHP